MKYLPEFMTYVVPGYLFLAVYRYILFKDEQAQEQTAHSLLNSVAISFVLKTVYDWLIFVCSGASAHTTETGYLLGILAMGVCSAYCLARAVTSPRMIEMFKRIGVSRTIHSNIWDDILGAGIWLRVWLRDSDKSYLRTGQVYRKLRQGTACSP